ncbi:MAG: polyprenyl synthetase family protein [Piscirickettsiaceae bacterium]|nr:polyprenyl synthetase family protein [Piscirickettsiaceae bacterium]
MLQHQQRIESVLNCQLLDHENRKISVQLLAAMRYSTLNGGKRLRALLVYATGKTLNADFNTLDAPASAVEMIHTYSLVHDDMPIMDNDDLRRGRPTCHKAYDDATALLVGDALQTLAFESLCDDKLTSIQQNKMVKTLAQRSGVYGMASGQAIDLESTDKTLDLASLQTMHELKTGALFQASVRLGALASGDIDDHSLSKLDHYAFCLGLAFQVRDDILDVIANTDTLGKIKGADIALNKPTYPALIGLAQAQRKADDLIKRAQIYLNDLSYDTHILSALAQFVIRRSN